MRVLIDALSARGGGGFTYIRCLLPNLLKVGEGYEFHILLSQCYQTSLVEALPEDISRVVVNVPAAPLCRRWGFMQKKIPEILKDGKFDLLFTVTEIGCLRSPVPHVLLVRNANLYAPLSVFTRWNQRLRLLIYQAVRAPLAYLTIRSADRIVFVSGTFRDEVVRRLCLSVDKTRVVHHGVNPIFFSSNVLEAKKDHFPWSRLHRGPYLLTVSVIYSHKNYETLLDAFALILRRGPAHDLHLVIAGGVGDQRTYVSLQKQARRLGIVDRVHFLGSVEYEKLPVLYRNALLFVFPSRLESFGHPLVEAMASGTPIVASDLPVCREICQDAAVYFNVNDASELAERIITLVENPELRRRLREFGLERAKEFSWERTAAQMVEIFEEVVKG